MNINIHEHNKFLIFQIKDNAGYCPNCLVDKCHDIGIESGNPFFNPEKVNAENAQLCFDKLVQKHEKYIFDREVQRGQREPMHLRGKLILQTFVLYGLLHICYCVIDNPVRNYLALGMILFIYCSLSLLGGRRGV